MALCHVHQIHICMWTMTMRLMRMFIIDEQFILRVYIKFNIMYKSFRVRCDVRGVPASGSHDFKSRCFWIWTPYSPFLAKGLVIEVCWLDVPEGSTYRTTSFFKTEICAGCWQSLQCFPKWKTGQLKEGFETGAYVYVCLYFFLYIYACMTVVCVYDIVCIYTKYSAL